MLPEVAELVIQEADEILGGIPHVVLTIKNNTLMANANIICTEVTILAFWISCALTSKDGVIKNMMAVAVNT